MTGCSSWRTVSVLLTMNGTATADSGELLVPLFMGNSYSLLEGFARLQRPRPEMFSFFYKKKATAW